MMAFHVACPITCERICYCPLGFGKKIIKKCFLDDVFKVEQFFNDPWCVKVNKDSQTVQVLVPKVVVPPPAPLPIHIGNSNAAVDVVVVNKEVVESGGGGDGEREEKEMLSLQAKRIALQKQAFEASIAAEEYVRKIESGVLMDDSGEALPDHFREDQGMKVMCRICFDGENEGSEKASRMLACKLCNKKYHRSCLKSWGLHRDLFHLSSWVCSSCRTCEVCRRTGNPTKFMFCKRCDGAHHCYCLQHAQKNVSIGPYLCPKHTKCHSCASNVSGNGPSTKWFLGYTFCDACGRLFVKGNYCPVCLKVYRDTEPTPMVCCDVCQRWVHCQCDGISDDKYLQFQADGNLYYKCAACRGECYKVTGPEDAVQEVWRRRDKADHDLIASLRDAAGLPSEEAFSVSIYSDDEDYNPTVSKNDPGGSLKFSVKGSGLKGTKKKSSKKIYGKKKRISSLATSGEDAHHSFDGHAINDQLSST
ncbi:hypothetical protein IFM89_017309 [Coptis chinensis]|uniref:Uncharacterized protein n=1 Tax=Coptis chinensis TaxID=261450 RepID=A0A835H4H4_9MAGN|nr:hypothetical protein IFM89_017309 [Coptis chinensis]